MIRIKKKINVNVVVCNICGFKISRDAVGIEAMGDHYAVAHKSVAFDFWNSMHHEVLVLE